MFLESLFIILLILVFTVIFYRAAIHEYTILQRNWSDDSKWSDLLAERAPLIVREIPAEWTKFWTIARNANFNWPVVINDGKQRVRSNLAAWLKAKNTRTHSIMNCSDLGAAAALPEQANEIGQHFRRPLWLPGSFAVKNTQANIIPPYENAFVGLQKTTAEATCWVATDGAPLRIWLAHEGATKGGEWLPAKPYGRNPWTIKTEETPWIAELKFLEIVLRPGNLLILPPHWWVAIKPHKAAGTTPVEGCWYWTTEFHSPISWVATRFHNTS